MSLTTLTSIGNVANKKGVAPITPTQPTTNSCVYRFISPSSTGDQTTGITDSIDGSVTWSAYNNSGTTIRKAQVGGKYCVDTNNGDWGLQSSPYKIPDGSSCTWGTWIYLSSTPTAHRFFMTIAGSGPRSYFYVNPSRCIATRFTDGPLDDTSVQISLNTWTHVMGAISSSGGVMTVKIYVNGYLAGTTQRTVSYTSLSCILLTSWGNATGTRISGYLTGMTAYNYTLSPENVLYVYQNA